MLLEKLLLSVLTYFQKWGIDTLCQIYEAQKLPQNQKYTSRLTDILVFYPLFQQKIESA